MGKSSICIIPISAITAVASAMPASVRLLSLDDWKKIIDNIVCDVQVKRFNLAGGEPLAAPYVQGMIDYIHACGVDCSIITNGSLLTPGFVRRNSESLLHSRFAVEFPKIAFNPEAYAKRY